VRAEVTVKLSDKDCLFVAAAAEAPVYAGSGWTAVRGQYLTEPGAGVDHLVAQLVVSFPSANDAGAFFTASAGGRARGRRGLSGRCRGSARQARRVRACGVRSDGVAADRGAGRGCAESVGGHRFGSWRRSRSGVADGRCAGTRSRDRRRAPAGDQPGRDAGDRALGQGVGGPDLQACLWFPPVVRVSDQAAAGSGEGPRTGRWNPAEPPDRATPHTPTPENESNKPIRKPSGHHARPEKDPG
jgi:hypothetical protein